MSRSGVTMLAAIAMTIALVLIVQYTSNYAVHLCGWSSLIQCREGTQLFWLVPIVTAAVALRALFLFAGWRQGAVPLWQGTSLTLWVILIFPIILMLRPRTFGPSELIAAGIWGTIGILLLYWTSTWLRRRSPHFAALLWLFVWIGFIRTLQAMPSVLLEANLQ